VLHCNRVCISSRFRDNWPQTYWGHGLDLSRSRDVIDHVTIWFAIYHFLLVVNWNRASISDGFRDICIQIYLGHDFELLGSRDVIEHATIWYPGCHFLRVLHCNGVCISSRFRDNGPETYWGYDLDTNSGPIFRHLWTKVNQILLASVGMFAICNAVCHLSISCFVLEIFAIKWRSGPKFCPCFGVFGPQIFSEREPPNFWHNFIN